MLEHNLASANSGMYIACIIHYYTYGLVCSPFISEVAFQLFHMWVELLAHVVIPVYPYSFLIEGIYSAKFHYNILQSYSSFHCITVLYMYVSFHIALVQLALPYVCTKLTMAWNWGSLASTEEYLTSSERTFRMHRAGR